MTKDLKIFNLQNFKIASTGSDGGHLYILAEITFKESKRTLVVFFADKEDEQKLKSRNTLIVKGKLVDEGPEFSLQLLETRLM